MVINHMIFIPVIIRVKDLWGLMLYSVINYRMLNAIQLTININISSNNIECNTIDNQHLISCISYITTDCNQQSILDLTMFNDAIILRFLTLWSNAHYINFRLFILDTCTDLHFQFPFSHLQYSIFKVCYT